MASVTVIVPTYNKCVFVMEAVCSVISQTFRDFDLLVVDDGSTDETGDFLEPMEEWLRYVRQPKGGEESARNRGILEAKTDYVAFLDDQDLWESNFLEVTMEHCRRHPEVGLVATASSAAPGGTHRLRLKDSVLQGDLYPALFMRNLVSRSGSVVKRECFERVGMFNESLYQGADYDMWLRIARSFSTALIYQPLCQRRRHGGNISTADLVAHRLGMLQVVRRNYDSTRIPARAYRRRCSGLHTSLGRAFLDAGRPDNAELSFRAAMAFRPWRWRPWWGICLARFHKTWQSTDRA